MNASFPTNAPRRDKGRPVVATCLAVLTLAGCATEVGSFTATEKLAPKPANHPIAVYTNGVPDRAFRRVATLDVRCESQGFMQPTIATDAIPMLIKQARAAGCDAIMDIKERKPPENWTFETKVLLVTATGIAF
jgi:hypothetical protein